MADCDDDKLNDECGVFGIIGHDGAAAMTAIGLHALQHRGQESVGIVSCDRGVFHVEHGLGHVGKHFGSESQSVRGLAGTAAIGHVRYATTGGATTLRNVQPLFADLEFGGFALAHNGNLTNAFGLRHHLVSRGSLFQSNTDTEVIVHLMARSQADAAVDRLIESLRRVEGAYSLVALAHDTLFGVRDPLGVRPLVLGRIGGAWVLASETCAFDIIDAEFVRDVQPGEMLVIESGAETPRSLWPFAARPSRFCIFEYIYFARPDSQVEGRSVYGMRQRIGAELAREASVAADMVVPVPDSGVPAAIGYAAASGLAFELGIIRSHYIGRTFIEPHHRVRHLGVKMKHNANRPLIEGKRLILIDDSIVRGTTSKRIVEMMRAAGAREVHVRISSPPTMHSCFYGIDTPDEDELLAHGMTVGAMAAHIEADSLHFISVDGLYRALGKPGRNPEQPQYCDACFTGDYPTNLADRASGLLRREVTRSG